MTKETRTQTIVRFTRQFLHGRSGGLKTLTMDIVENYYAMVPLEARTINFAASPDVSKNMVNNIKFVQRCLNGEIRFPAELEEAWVKALDAELEYRLTAELAARYGLLCVFKHDMPASSNLALEDSAVLMKETSEALTALAQMMETDNTIDYRDYRFLRNVKSELTDVASAALTLEQTVERQVMGSIHRQRIAQHAHH